MIVGTDVPTGIVNHYANPREVGVIDWSMRCLPSRSTARR